MKSYVTYRMAPLPMALNDLEVTIGLKPLYLTHLGKYSMYYLYNVYTWIGKRAWLVITTIISKMKDFSRSQPVMYTVNVVISGKQCQIELLLLGLHANTKKWYMAYQIKAIPVTLSHLQVHSLLQFSTKPRDWLGRTSLKWPILCWVGHKNLNSITQSILTASLLNVIFWTAVQQLARFQLT